MSKKKKAFLVLQDGTIYKGYSFGSKGYTEGEVVFNTGLTGYQEILTDPSYAGQIVTMTHPQIGNYGAISDDNESKAVQVRGFVVREYCDYPNNYRNEMSLGEYLEKKNIIAIEGIDTRSLTKKLRNSGTMLGFITTENLSDNELLEKVKSVVDISNADLVKDVSIEEEYVLEGSGLHIGVIDYGMKKSIAENFHSLGHKVTVMPSTITADKVLAKKFDIVLLSNGPGDPRTYDYAVKCIKDLIGKVPLAGICLGHQLLGLALGGKIYKLKFGHRGGNHPVKNLKTGKVWISTQNHGYVIDQDSLPGSVNVTYLNLNDNTVEGLSCDENRIYSVQFHPEAAPGPFDCHHIFQDFIDNLCKSVSGEKK